MKKSARVRMGLLLALMLVATTACGSRWTDEQRAAIKARNARSLTVGSSDADSGSSGTGGDVTAGDALAGDGSSAGSNGPSTGVGSATGSGSKATNQSGTKPCAAASSAPGVTDKTITVGSINSLSGPVPGISASAAAAARAYVAYRNAAGGVCGRQIVLKQADDGTDNSQYRTIISELGPKILGLTGGFALGDNGGADLVEAQKLPGVTAPSADRASAVSTVIDINPPYKNINASTKKYEWIKAQGGTKASVVYLDTDQSRIEANNHIALMKAAGINVVQVQALPLSTLSYDSAARSVVNSGADYMWFTAPTDANVSMANSLRDAGAKLKVAEYFIFAYGTNFAEQAGAAADGAYTFIRWTPNEEAAGIPELKRFVEWMDRVAAGEPKDSFAADIWAASKAFFDAIEAEPGPISRESLVTTLKSVKSYDADGMYGPIEFGAEKSNSCVVAMKLTGGKWKRAAPVSGFLC